MKSRGWIHITTAMIVIGISILGAVWYKNTIANSTYRTAVTIGEGGVSVALSYLLVVLYSQQRNIQENQLDVAKQELLPDIQCDVSGAELELKDRRAEFLISNYGNGSAKNATTKLIIEVPIAGKRITHKWQLINGGLEHNGEQYIADENTGIPFYTDISSQPFVTHRRSNKIDGWRFRRNSSSEDTHVKFIWKIEYEDAFSNTSDVLAARTNIISILKGYSVENQIRAQLRLAEYHIMEDRMEEIARDVNQYLK